MTHTGILINARMHCEISAIPQAMSILIPAPMAISNAPVSRAGTLELTSGFCFVQLGSVKLILSECFINIGLNFFLVFDSRHKLLYDIALGREYHERDTVNSLYTSGEY